LFFRETFKLYFCGLNLFIFLKEKLQIQSNTYHLKRYPVTTDKSLRAWSNAELLALNYIVGKKENSIHLYNDRFGVWNCVLQAENPITVCTYASQQKAIVQNLILNSFSNEVVFKTPLDDLKSVDLVLLKIPKSLELFEMFLQQIHDSATDNTEVVCCFMLKYFSSSILKIANHYFEEVSQSKAWKKARLLTLKKPNKILLKKELINSVFWKEKELKQYYGVFSSGNVDVGTRFFLENLSVKPEEKKVLDVASGNGIIAYEVTKLNLEAKVTLVDDFNLAIASSKLNLSNEKASFMCAENLENLQGNNFDLVVSNPPFHFEYENNIEITLSLFKGVFNCLKQNGRFLLVANSHLNYKVHLERLFSFVKTLNSNNKFVIYECVK